MSHVTFVALSYGVSAVLLIALTAWIVLSARRAKAQLDAFDEDKS